MSLGCDIIQSFKCSLQSHVVRPCSYMTTLTTCTGVDAGERRKSDGRERQVFFAPLRQVFLGSSYNWFRYHNCAQHGATNYIFENKGATIYMVDVALRHPHL